MIEAPAPRPVWKRLLRKALLWTLTMVIVLVAGVAYLDRDEYRQSVLPFVVRQIQEHKVWSATIRDDEQRVEITTRDGRRFHAEWQDESQVRELLAALNEAQPPGGYTIEVSRTSLLLIPLVVLIGTVLATALVVVSRRSRRLRAEG